MTAHATYTVNPGKELTLHQREREFFCFAIKTHVVTSQDNLAQIMQEYVAPVAKPHDIIFISEKMVACAQGRAIPLNQIEPGFWARLLSRFVTKTPTGIGLGMPQTMQCAINECGLPRILLASAAGAVGKLLGLKGLFYKVTGPVAAGIDGPCEWTIPPYNQYVVLTPQAPDKTAAELSAQLGGVTVLIVDINDLGGQILGNSGCDLQDKELLSLLKQNPLGQGSQSTPIGILRETFT